MQHSHGINDCDLSKPVTVSSLPMFVFFHLFPLIPSISPALFLLAPSVGRCPGARKGPRGVDWGTEGGRHTATA